MPEDVALLVLCTAPDEDAAADLARGLVDAKLAACVNVLSGVRSFYTWKGEVCDDSEVQLLIKTRQSRYEALAGWLSSNHPYEVPEILALRIERGSRAYLGWLADQTTVGDAEPPG